MISMIRDKKAEGYVDSGVKILIAIVIGTLLLSGLYVLASENVLPTVKERVESLFDYCGGNVMPVAKVTGDINGDGVADQSDVDILLYELANDFPSGYDDSLLDITGDGVVDGMDVIRLKKTINGK